MSEEDKSSAVARVDRKTFKRQVDNFVQHHIRRQEELLRENKRRNLSLEDVIQRSPPLSDEAVDLLFGDDQQSGVQAAVIDEVRDALQTMQGKINKLDQKKRFFILETINFFSSKIGIGKLIPALIILSGEDQKKAICEFIFPTFLSVQKNIETLVACDEIFDAKTLHIDRGGLYSFVSDIARIVIRLFKEPFIARACGDHDHGTLGFLTSAFDNTSFRFNDEFRGESEFIYQEMIDDDDRLRATVLEFIVAIQSHESLYTYAIKRDQYYKHFLSGLTAENRFKDVDPIDISKILAGCLLANEQLQPSGELIERMIDKALFNADDTLDLRRQFIENLSPSIIFRLIGRLRVSLQHISKSNFGNEFQEIQKFSVKSILKTVWSGFITLVEKGLTITTGPFLLVFSQIKRAYEGFIEEEQQLDAGVKSSMFGLSAAKSDPMEFQSKNLDAFSQMTQSFKLVSTSVISFRGAKEGATFKDFGYNIRLFRNDEGLMVQFLTVFRLLFKKLAMDEYVKEITYDNQRKIREYYAAYQFDRYLICIGLTHIKNPKLPVIDEKSIFPYVLLFVEEQKLKEGRVAGRTIKQNGKIKNYNELHYSAKTAKLFFEALYLILHLLPGEAWENKSSQLCVSFLTKELDRMLKKGEKLLYYEGKQ
ncbi:MAG: hypothetical protein ABIK68_19300 [bacterium]